MKWRCMECGCVFSGEELTLYAYKQVPAQFEHGRWLSAESIDEIYHVVKARCPNGCLIPVEGIRGGKWEVLGLVLRKHFGTAGRK